MSPLAYQLFCLTNDIIYNKEEGAGLASQWSNNNMIQIRLLRDLNLNLSVTNEEKYN